MKTFKKIKAIVSNKEDYQAIRLKIEKLLAQGWELSGSAEVEAMFGSQPPVWYSQKLTRKVCFRR